MNEATPVLKDPGKFGMTGAAYLHHSQRYLMIGWYYPAGGGRMKGASTDTLWDLGNHRDRGDRGQKSDRTNRHLFRIFSAQVCPKFQTSDKVLAFTAGNWNSPKDYRLTVVTLKIST